MDFGIEPTQVVGWVSSTFDTGGLGAILALTIGIGIVVAVFKKLRRG